LRYILGGCSFYGVAKVLWVVAMAFLCSC